MDGELPLLAGYPALLLGAVLVTLIIYLLLSGSNSQQEWKEPPGPKPLPVVGNLLNLDLKRPYLSLCELSKKYGPVFSLHFGSKKTVVLAGYKTVKQALVNQAEDFGNRDVPPIFHDLTKNLGILWASGDNWKVMRRFALSSLRDSGMGKRRSEVKIIEEIDHLKIEFEKFEGKPFDTTYPVNIAVSNIICAIMYGSRYDYEDPTFKDMIKRANQNTRLLGSTAIQLYNMFPKLFFKNKTWKILMQNTEINRNEMQQMLNNLQKTLNIEDSRGFVDDFLIRKALGEKDVHFHDQNLLTTVSNLFVAGTDTTSTSIRWGLLLMAKYPHIQDHVQKEIDQVVGDRQPVMEDRKKLPYTDAVIHEIQRLANIVPMSLPHITMRDIQFQGFFIKKGTSVIPLLTSVLKDENEWESPHTFNPGHFLDEDGHFVKRDAFIPFSAGRRVCLGEGLARMELFLFFTSLLQHFRFTPPPGVSEDQLNLTPDVGFTLNPMPHELCAVSRT